MAACIFDEVSFWRDDTTATPDTETYTAVLPSLITTNGMLVGISSPYRRLGLIHAKHKRYFGTNSDDTLVVQGSTLAFNQTLDADAIAAQMEADPTAARSEWDAQFRADISGFLDDELIDAAIDHARPLELPPRPGVFYKAYVDASGGAAGGDAYCLGIAHRESGCYILDVVRGRQGAFDPEELTKEYAQLCKQYHCAGVVGDRYAREWVASAWRKQAVPYATAALTASETYLECLPLWTRALVRIPTTQSLRASSVCSNASRPVWGKTKSPIHATFTTITPTLPVAALYGLANAVGAYQDLLGKAFGEDEPEEVVLRQRQEAERRHRNLMARYGGPISL